MRTVFNFIRQSLVVVSIIVYLVAIMTHNNLVWFFTNKRLSRNLKTGTVTTKDRLGFTEATYKNTFDFWRGKKLY